MFDLLTRAAAGTGFTCLMTAAGAAAVFLLGRELSPALRRGLMGFAAGVMVAAAVWSLLLPSIAVIGGWRAACAATAGAAFLLLPDLFLRFRGKALSPQENRLFPAAITLHNVPEGMAVGLACALAISPEARAAALAVALGVGIQNVPEGAAISLPLYQAGRSRTGAFALGALSGAVEPFFGILAAASASAVVGWMPWLLGFAAGAMLYAAAEELAPRSGGRSGGFGFLSGFLLMMVLDTALG